MKVYFISSGLQGCYFLRCLLPLSANGWDGDQTSIRRSSRTPEDKMRAADDANIIVFHRPDTANKLELIRLLKKKGKKIVFDNDDTAKHDGGFRFNAMLDKKRVENGMKTINETLDSCIKESDLVTCSTEFLADEYRKLNPNVVVLPNCVDPFYYDEPLKNETDVVRIGITGSLAITDDLNVIEPIIRHYQGNKKVKFVLFSLPPASDNKSVRDLYAEEYKFWESVDVEWQPFVPMEEYYDTLNNLRLDIMLIPRADNYFNRCKSNVKFLEASMFEIPTIGQSFPDGKSPYEANPEDAKHLMLATTHEDWIKKIDALVDDRGIRFNMGEKARKYVIKNYSIEEKGKLWDEAYRKYLC